MPCGRFDGEDGGDGARATKKNGVTPLMCVCVLRDGKENVLVSIVIGSGVEKRPSTGCLRSLNLKVDAANRIRCGKAKGHEP